MHSASYAQLIETWTEGFASNKPFTLSPQFFSYSEEQNHEDASGLMKYAFEEVLGWTPVDVQNHCTKEVIDLLGLRAAYRALLWPYTYDLDGKKVPLIDSRSGYGYVAALLYPDVIHTLGKKNLWVMEYNTILSGKKGSKGFRIDDFLGNDGYDHARLLLNHYLIYHPDERFECLEDVYAIFSDKDKGEAILKDAKLLNISRGLFRNPMDFLHASLPDDDTEYGRSRFYYSFYHFENMLADVDVVQNKKQHIMEMYHKDKKSCYCISQSLSVDEDLLHQKIQEWDGELAESRKGQILTLYVQQKKSYTEIATECDIEEDVIRAKIEQWQKERAERNKEKILTLYHRKVSVAVISEKSKIDVDILNQKLEEWGAKKKSIEIGGLLDELTES